MADKVTPISKSTRIFKREDLINLLNESVGEINQIRGLYEDFFGSEEGSPSKLEQIEEKLTAISAEYTDLLEGDPTKVADAKTALDAIKAYHKELLEGPNSIKSDIEDSQEKITEFYIQLFQKSDGVTEDDGKKALIESAIKSITDFDALLNNASTGYKFTIEGAKDEITKAHDDVFGIDKKTKKSLIGQFTEEVQEAHKLHEEVKDVIVPFIANQRQDITKIATDIKQKQSEVDALLSNATVNTLAEGYRESMQTYGAPVLKKYPSKSEGGRWKYLGYYLVAYLLYFTKFIGSYILFIGPLVIIGALFVMNNHEILGMNISPENIDFSGSEYILYKLTIALPLLWVSWFGQRAISHRKRLFEEYNHKLRVVQMYMLFTAAKDTYSLSPTALNELEQELLATIARNPSHVYGKDETMVDKIIAIFTPKAKEEKASTELEDTRGKE